MHLGHVTLWIADTTESHKVHESILKFKVEECMNFCCFYDLYYFRIQYNRGFYSTKSDICWCRQARLSKHDLLETQQKDQPAPSTIHKVCDRKDVSKYVRQYNASVDDIIKERERF